MSPRAFMMALVSQTAEALESELATLSANIASATQRQLTLIRELEPTAIWAAHGATSYVAWLGWRIGLAPNAAREKIRIARALGQLPAIDDAFARARLSYSKVRALTRVADASNEAELLDMARMTTASHLETICRGLRRVVRDEQGAAVEASPPERWVRERATDDGMVRIEAQLSPDEAALVWKALELARGIGGSGTVIGAADGLVRVADAFVAGAREGQSGAERTQIVVHLRQEMLTPLAAPVNATADTPSDALLDAAEASCGCGAPTRLTTTEVPLVALLDDGSRVEPDALRRLACDATLVPIILDGAGLPIDVGRRTRVVSSSLRRALTMRDRGCRFPGCDHRAWIGAHHIEHWAHGGETKLANLVSLCSAHHRLVHEGGFTVAFASAGRAVFRRPDDAIVATAPMLPEPARRGVALDTGASAEAPFDDSTLLPDWDGRTPDYDACVTFALSRAAPGSDPAVASAGSDEGATRSLTATDFFHAREQRGLSRHAAATSRQSHASSWSG